MQSAHEYRSRARRWRTAGKWLIGFLAVASLILGIRGSETCDFLTGACKLNFGLFLLIAAVVFLGSLLPIMPLFGFASVFDGQADTIDGQHEVVRQVGQLLVADRTRQATRRPTPTPPETAVSNVQADKPRPEQKPALVEPPPPLPLEVSFDGLNMSAAIAAVQKALAEVRGLQLVVLWGETGPTTPDPKAPELINLLIRSVAEEYGAKGVKVLGSPRPIAEALLERAKQLGYSWGDIGSGITFFKSRN